MATTMFCKVLIRIAWNVGRSDYIVAGPYQAEDAFDKAWTMWLRRALAADRAITGVKFPKRVNVELYDFHAEESA